MQSLTMQSEGIDKHRRWIQSAAIGCALLTGCATNHRQIDFEHLASEPGTRLNCHVELKQLIDSTSASVHLSSSGDTYELIGITERIRHQFAAWQPIPSQSDTSIALSLELARAYPEVKAHQTYFYTVLLAHIADSEPRVIRGSHRVTNWWGTQAEFATVAEASLNDALSKFRSWLNSQCDAN